MSTNEQSFNPNSLDSHLTGIHAQLAALQAQVAIMSSQLTDQQRRLETRIETLETQRAWVVGVTTGISMAVGLVWTFVQKFLRL